MAAWTYFPIFTANWRWLCLLLFFSANGLAGGHKGEDKKILIEDQVKVLLKSLSYHVSPAILKNPDIVIAVLHDDSIQQDKIEEARKAFESNRGNKIGEKSFTVKDISFTDLDDLMKKIQESKANVAYVVAGSESAARKVVSATRKMKMISMGGDPNYLHWSGVCLGVESKGGSRKILVNLSGCKLEEVQFDPRLLRIASVVF